MFLALIGVGFFASWLLGHLLPRDFREGVNQIAWDAMMRDRVGELLTDQKAGSEGNWTHFVFIDINDTTCLDWLGKDCTLSSLTPRDRLTDIVRSITPHIDKTGRAEGPLPALVVLTTELAPVMGTDSKNDSQLCASVVELAARTPVIVVRPTTINLEKEVIEGHTSIFDAAFDPGHPDCRNATGGSGASTPGKDADIAWQAGLDGLWFGSPLVWTDPDGVVRRVGTRDLVDIVDAGGGIPHGQKFLGSIGLLGGALLNYQSSPFKASITCHFPGSQPLSNVKCGDSPDDAMNYFLKKLKTREGRSKSAAQILFSVPSDNDVNRPPYEGINKILCYKLAHVPLKPLSAGTLDGSSQAISCDGSDALAGAVVVIGGSFNGSGDLHATPIDKDRVPGAMIHVNAIRAFDEALRKDRRAPWILEGDDAGMLEWVLIGISAIIGTVSSGLAGRLVHGRDALRPQFMAFLMGIAGLVLQICLVFIVTLSNGLSEFIDGRLVTVLMPVLVVAVDGLSDTLRAMAELLEKLIHVFFGRSGRQAPTDGAGGSNGVSGE